MGRSGWFVLGTCGRRYFCPGAAAQRNQSLRQELLPGDAREHAAQGRTVKGRELGPRSEFRVFTPANPGFPSKAVADSTWVKARDWKAWDSTRKAMDGKRDAPAPLAAKAYPRHYRASRCP